ncbi:MAG: hypothetical protein AB2L17_02690 [Lentimicrobium sp.]
MKQLICFVDSLKFYSLNNEMFQNTKFKTSTTDELIYKNKDVDLLVDAYEPGRAHESAILIIPDSCEAVYSPSIPFKFLYHGDTPSDKKNSLLINLNCKGLHYSPEESGSIYEKISKLLFVKEGFQEKFDEIYGEIKMIDPKIRVVINYLHSCQNQKTIIEVTQGLSDFDIDLSILKDNTFKNFTEIRNNLISQCNFEQSNS